MDPFSHAALGRTLIALVPEERGTRALAVAGTFGALSPDVDAVLMPFGWDLYLRAHEVGTHTFIGTLACALLTAAVVRLFGRAQPWRALAGAAWVGAASHVGLDLLSSARLRVLWPLADHQASVPLVAMADPWLAALLIGGAGAIVFCRRYRRHAAGVVIGVSAVFLLIKGAFAMRAIEAYRIAEGVENPGKSRVVEARWATLFQWHIFDRTAGQLRFWRSSGRSGEARLVLSWPVEAPSPRIAASRSLSTVGNFLRVHDLTFAAIVDGPDGHQRILWSDIRYCWDPDAGNAPQLEPMISANAASGARLSCALWFGGEFDGSGRPLQQIVTIGGLTQTRPVGD